MRDWIMLEIPLKIVIYANYLRIILNYNFAIFAKRPKAKIYV